MSTPAIPASTDHYHDPHPEVEVIAVSAQLHAQNLRTKELRERFDSTARNLAAMADLADLYGSHGGALFDDALAEYRAAKLAYFTEPPAVEGVRS